MKSLGKVVVDVARRPEDNCITLRCGSQQRGGPTIYTTEIHCGPRITESDMAALGDVFEGTFLSVVKRTVGIQLVLL